MLTLVPSLPSNENVVQFPKIFGSDLGLLSGTGH